MKYINTFEEFLFEKRHVNTDVIHSVNDIIKIIETFDFTKRNVVASRIIKLNHPGFILSNLILKVYLNPISFRNYGYFSENNCKVVGSSVDGCELFIELLLSENEIKRNTISINNKIYELLNHELNHGLEIYKMRQSGRAMSASWELSKKIHKHRSFADKYKVWEDFIHIVYLSLDHEIQSRISQSYEEIKHYINPLDDIKDNKTYKEALFLSNFNFDNMYNKFVSIYGTDKFKEVCKVYFEDFDYTYKDDLDYCKNVIRKIINKINNKGKNMVKKLYNVAKRVDDDNNNVQYTTEAHCDKMIDYTEYIKK